LIEITRSLARQLKTIFRRTISETGRGTVNQPVFLPAETAAARIDFGDWLRTLGGWRRRIAETLPKGDTTSVAVAKFRVSLGRISQLRRELHDDWERFHGEVDTVHELV